MLEATYYTLFIFFTLRHFVIQHKHVTIKYTNVKLSYIHRLSILITLHWQVEAYVSKFIIWFCALINIKLTSELFIHTWILYTSKEMQLLNVTQPN
jgi:hypothetical protein